MLFKKKNKGCLVKILTKVERKNEHSEYNYNRKTGLNLKNTNNGKISLIVLERCIFYMKIIKLRNLSQN